MMRSTVRKVTNREVAGAVARRESFQGNSTSATTSTSTHGVLPSDWSNLLHEQYRAGRVVYVVLSYSTPIAWELSDGTVVSPAVKYSVTTSKAQGYVEAGFSGSRIVRTLEDAQQL